MEPSGDVVDTSRWVLGKQLNPDGCVFLMWYLR